MKNIIDLSNIDEFIIMVLLAQLVRALDCDSRGCRFEPGIAPLYYTINLFLKFMVFLYKKSYFNGCFSVFIVKIYSKKNILMNRVFMTVGVYGIFDANTDECLYVGMSSVSVEKRFKQHLKNLRNGNHPRKDFVEWYHENGAVEELFDFRVLEECESDEAVLNALEIKWFNELLPKFFGKVPSLNERWVHSEESKKKVSKSMRKYAESLPKIDKNKCLNCDNKVKNNRNKYCSINCNNLSNKKNDSLIFHKDKIIELYKNGKSLEEISYIFSTTRKTLSNFFKSEGITIKKRGAKQGDKSPNKGKYSFLGIEKNKYIEIYNMSKKGYSTRKISSIVGCSQPTIVNVLNKIKKDPNLLL